MQIFIQPIFEQPTFFLEFIERRHSVQGIGQGNFQALFEAVERQKANTALLPMSGSRRQCSIELNLWFKKYCSL